jgi:hypothetical protein
MPRKLIGLLAAFCMAGCGGSGSGPGTTDGGGGSTDGGGGSTGGSGGSSTGGSGGSSASLCNLPSNWADLARCNLPNCWAELAKDCVPMGTCTTSFPAGDLNICYSNGVKQLSYFQGSGMCHIFSGAVIKPNGSICYTIEFASSAGSTTVMGIKNPSGSTVATVTTTDQTGKFTVTCTGEQPVVIDAMSCGNQPPRMVGAGGSGACTMGVCM